MSASAGDKVFCGGARGVVKVLDARTLSTVASFSTKMTVTVTVTAPSRFTSRHRTVFDFITFNLAFPRQHSEKFIRLVSSLYRLHEQHLIPLLQLNPCRVECWSANSAVGAAARRGSASQTARPSSASSARSAVRATSTGRLRTPSVSAAATTQGMVEGSDPKNNSVHH